MRWISCFISGLLQVPHARIRSLHGEQLRVRAALGDAAVVHHQDLVRIHHGRQAVGNHQCGFVLGSGFELSLDGPFVGRAAPSVALANTSSRA